MKKIILMLLVIASVHIYGMNKSSSSEDSLPDTATVQDKPNSTTKIYTSSNSVPEDFMYEKRTFPIQSHEPNNTGGLGSFIHDQATGGTPTQRNSLGKAFRWMAKTIGSPAVAQELIGLGKKEEGTATKQIYKKVDALLDADLSIEQKTIDSYTLRFYYAANKALELHNELVDLRINDEKRPEYLVPFIEKANRLLNYSTSAEDHSLKSSILPPKIVESLNREISNASKRMQRKE